jgi:hypothetical protein
VFEIGSEITRTLADELDFDNFWRVNQVNGLDGHTTEPDGDFKGCSKTFSSLIGKNQTTMSDSLFAFKSLLISNINNISRPDVGHKELFSSEGFLSLFLLNYALDVLPGFHGSVHGGD